MTRSAVLKGAGAGVITATLTAATHQVLTTDPFKLWSSVYGGFVLGGVVWELR